VDSRLGLTLGGGGFLGAVYELGALAALNDCIDGLDLRRFDIYVGVSAGAFIAAGLANGLSPQTMIRMFVETEDADFPLDPAALLRPAWGELRKKMVAMPSASVAALRDVARPLLRAEPQALRTAGWRLLDQVSRLLPTAILDGEPAQRRFKELYSSGGRSDDFRELKCDLRIVATDIDTGEAVSFGSPHLADIPISTAVRASSAIPGLFAPVTVNGRRYLDGALNKTLHASEALNAGAKLVFALNPLVPLVSGSTAKTRAQSLPSILSQSIRTAIRSRVGIGLEKYRLTHKDADVILIEPRSDDTVVFNSRIFSFSDRRRLCEHAYQQTRKDLIERYDALQPILAKHGMQLNLELLKAEDLQLVRSKPRARTSRMTQLGRASRRLSHALDDLERATRIAGATNSRRT
jgi:NTE family protein